MSEFVWKAEELALKELTDEQLQDIVKQYTLEEMQVANDTYSNGGKFSKFWERYNEFQSEKDTIKHQINRWNGEPTSELNTNSLKAWAKSKGYHIGYCFEQDDVLKWHMIGYDNLWLTWDIETINKQIPNIFFDLLKNLRSEEKSWFREHDEYSIVLDKINKYRSEYGWHLPLTVKHEWWISGNILVYNDDESAKRKLTLKELKQILAVFEAKEALIKEFDKKSQLDIEF